MDVCGHRFTDYIHFRPTILAFFILYLFSSTNLILLKIRFPTCIKFLRLSLLSWYVVSLVALYLLSISISPLSLISNDIHIEFHNILLLFRLFCQICSQEERFLTTTMVNFNQLSRNVCSRNICRLMLKFP